LTKTPKSMRRHDGRQPFHYSPAKGRYLRLCVNRASMNDQAAKNRGR
jgi:hypothetical protein